jgi:hypothetical protein
MSSGTWRSVMKWHWNVSSAGQDEKTNITQAVKEFNTKANVSWVKQNSPPSGDYVHITGIKDGCWSEVGRKGGVSSTVQGVVMTSLHCVTNRSNFAVATAKDEPFQFTSCYQIPHLKIRKQFTKHLARNGAPLNFYVHGSMHRITIYK